MTKAIAEAIRRSGPKSLCSFMRSPMKARIDRLEAARQLLWEDPVCNNLMQYGILFAHR